MKYLKSFENYNSGVLTSDEILELYKKDGRRIPYDVIQSMEEFKEWKMMFINPNSVDTLQDDTLIYEKDPQNTDYYEKNIKGRMEKEGDNFPILIEYKYKSPKDEWHYKKNSLYPKPLDGWHRLMAARRLGWKKVKILIPVNNL